MSLGTVLVIILIIILLGGFSGRFRGYGYGRGHSGMGLIGVILIVVLILVLLGKIALADPDHDLILDGDHLEQGDLVGGECGLNHNALHDEGGKPETEQRTF